MKKSNPKAKFPGALANLIPQLAFKVTTSIMIPKLKAADMTVN